MTLVAVSQRTEFITKYSETRDALDQRWHDVLTQCSITPVLIPNHIKATQKIINELPISGVILTGGNDSPARLASETMLIDFAITNKIPLLGVCHGMQAIQRYFGVTLSNITGHVIDHLPILVNGKSCVVNSYHDLGTTESTSELIVWAQAKDNIVKAICHQSLPIVGIMWHPERYPQPKQGDIELIINLFNKRMSHNLLDALRGQLCELSY